MSDMKMLDQRGVLNGLLIPFILVIVLLIGAGSFGAWAFASRQDYKNNVDAKITAAQAVTKQQTQAADQATYNQQAKYPLRAYVGPAAFGNVTVNYPKTWSAYVIDDDTSTPVNGFFQPSYVQDVGNSKNTFALRVQVVGSSYSQQMAGFSSQVQSGAVTVAPYSLPKVPKAVGSIVTGQIEDNVQGIMVLLPLRNMTLEIWTEQPAEESDFTNIILPNLTFEP